MNESHKYNIEGEKCDTNEYTPQDFLYTKFKGKIYW